ncbi:MAG: ArsR family transcriptional regulator, partial [Vicinamibacteria bacterium]|nr:ArsR family transcriptional regulator [Vicinamibacteria bacterium]
EAIGDVWEMFERILEARKRREVDPAIAILRACLDEDASQREKGHGDASRERLEALLELFENASSAFDQLRTWPRSTVKRAIKLGGGMRRLLEKIS